MFQLPLPLLRHAIPAKDARRKLPDFEFPGVYQGPVHVGRRSDMDPNGHINNVAYLAWAMDAVPDHIYDSYNLFEVSRDSSKPGEDINYDCLFTRSEGLC